MTETRNAEKTFYVPALGTDEEVERLESRLGNLNGVVSCDVMPDRQRVRIEWTEAMIDWPAILAYLEELGFAPAGEAGG